jgi:hypothetical protein
LCAKLTAKRRDFAERSRNELGRQLEAVLRENPPPSLREVHARHCTTRAITYGNFPEIHCAIAARHRKFQRQNK